MTVLLRRNFFLAEINRGREGRWFGKKLEIYLNRSCDFRIVIATANVCISQEIIEKGRDDYPEKTRNLERKKRKKRF